tara:strand:- start:2161 stop:3102 length:942 start_codon:yes stop_codon:yes gene_type:complete
MAVQTNETYTSNQAEYFKRFTSLNPTAEPLPQGDGQIRISPFDDYVIFTIFDETGENGDLADSPIDLSNVGTLTLVFVGENDEIRIPNWTQVENVDLAQGQVLFRIDKENSKKILSLDNKNFYISTRMEDEFGISDESVLYTGTFLGLTDAAQERLTTKMNAQSLLYSEELSRLQSEIDELNTTLGQRDQTISEMLATLNLLEQSNISLSDENALLYDQLDQAQSDIVAAQAAAAQSSVTAIKSRMIQQAGISEIMNNAASNINDTSYWENASALNEEFNTASNTVTDIGFLDKFGDGLQGTTGGSNTFDPLV